MRIVLMFIFLLGLNVMAKNGSGDFMYQRCVVGGDKFAMDSPDCVNYRKLHSELQDKNASIQKVSVTGTYYKNLRVEVSKNPKNYDGKASETAKTAQRQCVDNGFKFKSAFYFEEHNKKLYLTDVFCSNEKAADENARVVIMRDRKARGASLHPSAKSVMASKNGIEFTGFTPVDIGQPSDAVKGAVDAAVKAAKDTEAAAAAK